MKYAQFCPIAKATEIIGDRWTILIIRELLMGATRFNQLQRGLGRISPTMLSKRLDFLAERDLIMKKKIPAQKGYEYFPTATCQDFRPVIMALGQWGMRWVKTSLIDEDYDVELLMLYLTRSINPAKLIGRESVIRFHFTDISRQPYWWLVVIDDKVELCVNDPCRDIDVNFVTTVTTMVDIWTGNTCYKQAIRDDLLSVSGNRLLTRSITEWMPNLVFADLPSTENI